jgi:solute carrier family 25 (mitochondrial phosphate transporter), member 23/24/25/41
VTFTYPLDIVRTRLSVQSASFKELGAKRGDKLPGMFGLIVSMYKTEGGWIALYRGIVPTIMGVAPYVRCISCLGAVLIRVGRLELHDI